MTNIFHMGEENNQLEDVVLQKKSPAKLPPRRHSHGNWGTLELAEAAAAVLCGVAWEAQRGEGPTTTIFGEKHSAKVILHWFGVAKLG